MAGSAADAISKAVERSKQLLFPFKAEKWFGLGFTVFLAQCGEGGGGSFPNIPSGGSPSSSTGSGGPDFSQMFRDAVTAVYDNLALYLVLGSLALLVSFGLWGTILWFSSRAKLMLVESVVWDRVDFSGQWTRAAELGFGLFKFRALFTLGGALLGLAFFGGAAAVGWADFMAGQFLGSGAIVAYSLLGFATFFVSLPWAIVMALLDDFVVPLMVIRNTAVGEAWGMCRREVLRDNVGGMIVFYVLRFVLAIAVGIVAMMATCVTCCITAIPYIGTVVLLPVFVFWRAFPLYYLEELGVSVFPAPTPEWVAYDQWRFPR